MVAPIRHDDAMAATEAREITRVHLEVKVAEIVEIVAPKSFCLAKIAETAPVAPIAEMSFSIPESS